MGIGQDDWDENDTSARKRYKELASYTLLHANDNLRALLEGFQGGQTVGMDGEEKVDGVEDTDG
jgi:hypothetical protein